jgi:heme O synthase-like polyprenyltransferase
LLFSAADAAYAAYAASSSVGRCIQTDYLLVFVVLASICFMIVAAATIIHLMDCLYDGFMDRKSKRIAEEPSTAAEATAATAAKAATAAEESSSTAEATSATAAKAATAAESAKSAPLRQCALFWYSIHHC